jgi:hypothetical protein
MRGSVKVNFNRIRDMAEQCVKDYKLIYGDLNYQYQPKLRAFIKSIVVMNAIFRNDKIPTQYKACEEDYETFERIFRRLTEDHFKIMSDPKKKGQITFNQKKKEAKKASSTKVIN